MDDNKINSDNQEKDIPELTPEEKLKPRISPVLAAFIGLLIVFILYQFVGGTITVLILGFDLQKMDPAMLRLLTIAGQMLFILLPALIMSKMIYEDVTTIVRFKFPRLKEMALFLMGLLILMPLLQNLTYIQTYAIEKFAAGSPFIQQIKDFFDNTEKFLETSFSSLFTVKSFIDLFLIVVAVSVTPAICEEVFFRGFIQKSFELKWKPFWAIIVSSSIFALYHFSPYGFFPIFFLGIFLGYSAYKSNSIFIPVSLHFANNLIMIILYFIVGAESMETKPAPDIPINSFIVLLFLNSLAFIAWLFFVKKFYNKLRITEGGRNDLSKL
jgi:uncharacterized protein